MLDKMRKVALTPNVISFSAAIPACAKGGQWERACSLLHKMRQVGFTSNIISFSAVISAC